MASILINGQNYQFEDNSNINISANKIIVNGIEITDYNKTQVPILNITVNGPVNNITSELSINIKGDVSGSIKAGNSINCNDVNGDVKAGNSISCKKVSGNIKAGGNISM